MNSDFFKVLKLLDFEVEKRELKLNLIHRRAKIS